MVKRILWLALMVSLILWSCVTYQPAPPNIYTGELPQSIVADLSLDERILVEDAWKNIREGRAKKAEKMISKLGIQNPFYYVGLGYVSYIMGYPLRAEEYFKTSLSEFPEMTLSHFGLAQIYQETGQEDLAFTEYREILKEDPDNSWAKPRLADISFRRTEELLREAKGFLSAADTEKSKEAYLKALHYSPDLTEAHIALSRIYKEEGNFQSTLLHLHAVYSQVPQSIDIKKEYADTLFQAGELKKSLPLFEEISQAEPDNKEIQKRLETIKNRLGIFELPSQYESIQFSDAISKEEVAALLSVKFKNIIDEPSGKPPIIIDISTSWASTFILQMASLGVLDIYPNHTFQPKKIITRAEMAEILFRLIEHLKRKGHSFIQQIPPDKIRISDVSAGNYYYRPILLMISYDIMDLSGDREFHPDQAVSGQEAGRLTELILALIK
ncbi:MAG: S-layer homology domain-containing protein [Candidatus Aminicenantes bacterium]|nr:S-layer homology domain-containing protein [Candidatus Aminicenantes bacterium]